MYLAPEELKENHSKTFTGVIKILKDLNFSNAKVIQNIVSGSRKHKSEMKIENKMADEKESTKILKLAKCLKHINNEMEDKAEAEIQERVEQNYNYQVSTKEPGYVLEDKRKMKIPLVQSSHKWRISENEQIHQRKKEEEEEKKKQQRQEEKENKEKEEKRQHKENKKQKKHKHHKTKRNHSDE